MKEIKHRACPQCGRRTYEYLDPEGRTWIKCLWCGAQVPKEKK